MPARKARKLADGSRHETVEDNESDNFSVDDQFSLEESRAHRSFGIRKSLEGNQSKNGKELNGSSNKIKDFSSLSEEEAEDNEIDGKEEQTDGFSQAITEDDEFSQDVLTNASQLSTYSNTGEEDEDDNNLNDEELVADCGTIESMTLVNFMCHDHFEITFNPRVNFVIGKNGSGKSAILTAIVVVLGGRATNTGRSQSLVNFIKNGKTSAKVSIKLCNYSPFKKKTFKYTEYGKSIIVERIIKSDGSSNYVLKSAVGKVISRKKEELNEIISLFSIQIENPVCILSQEVSRNFLNSKNARDKYDFFMKATNLEQLRQSYAFALQQSKQAKEILAKKKSFLPAIEKEVKELEKKVDVFRKFNKKKDQLEFLKSEWVWAGVKELEKLETGPPKVISELDKKIDDCTERLEEIKKESLELERKKDDESYLDEFQNKIAELEVKSANLNKRYDELRKSRCEKSLKINELNFSISNCNKDKAQLQKKIDDIKEQIAEQEKLMAEQERIKAKRIELQNEQEKLKVTIAAIRKEKESHQEEFNKLTDSIKSLNYKLTKLRSDLTNKDNLLKNLKGSKRDSLAKFGQPFVRLVKMIEDENRKGKFKHKPIGPLGNYIKLKDDHVSTALETCLKGLMFAFVCDNFNDADHLGKLIKSVNNFQQQPIIIRRKFGQRFNIRNAVEFERYKSLLHYVTIENDQVFNIIMDKSSLDQTLYIPVDKNAIELLVNNENRLPSNLKMAYSSVGTQFYPKRNGSNFRQYTTNRKASGILTSDPTMYINKIETEVNDLNENIKQILDEKSSIESSIKELGIKLKEFDREIDQNHSKLHNISKQMYELSSVKEFKPEDLDIFECDYQSCVDQLKKFQDDLQTTKEDVKDIEDKIKIVKSDQNINTRDIQDAREELEAEKKKIRENEFLLKKYKQDIEKIEKRIEEFNERKGVQMELLTDLRCKKEDAIKKAKKIHDEPIDTNRQPDVIQKEMDDLKQFIIENENRLGNLEELSVTYKEKKAHLDKTKDHVEFLENYISEFSESIRKRAKFYIKLRDHITADTAEKFTKNLQFLNFNGTMSIFHKAVIIDGKEKKAQSLDLNINPKSSDPNKMYKDTRSLSGGERSYSTVAFLIALWESSYSPFNILDEVDVFMDRVTRNQALDALITSANKKQGKQYIFLSPLRPEKQAINNLLRIFYMPEPKRVEQTNS